MGVTLKHNDGTPADTLEYAPGNELQPVPTVELPDRLAQNVSYGPDGIRGIFSSPYVFGAALLASLGGYSFGYGTRSRHHNLSKNRRLTCSRPGCNFHHQRDAAVPRAVSTDRARHHQLRLLHWTHDGNARARCFSGLLLHACARRQD